MSTIPTLLMGYGTLFSFSSSSRDNATLTENLGNQQHQNAEKRMKFATKAMLHYPSHLRHVATLPREIKKFKLSANVEENANKLHFNRL